MTQSVTRISAGTAYAPNFYAAFTSSDRRQHYNRTYELLTTILAPPMTRLWTQGDPIDVVAADGHPQRFTWRERTHQVEEVTRYWRADVGWWTERKWRAYHKLVTDTGLLVIIYQDLEQGGWYLQRLYD